MTKNILDKTGGNTKLGKTNKSAGGVYRVAGLSLMPSDTLCPSRWLAQCANPCLESSGRGRMKNVIDGRQRKADWFASDPESFLAQLRRELFNFIKTCDRQGVKPAARLNVLSDVPWERHGIPQEFPELFMYDYTKLAHRLGRTPKNYQLMFSYSGAAAYQNQVKKALKTDVPISAVFRGPMPSEFLGRRVIDGDASDLVNVMAGPVVVGLQAKGKAKTDEGAFVVDTRIIARAAA